MFTAVLLLLLTFVRVAQPADTWYFAQSDTDLIAFTVDGTRHDLLANAGDIQAAWRIDANTALFLIDAASTSQLYRISSNKATKVDLTGDFELSNSQRVIGFSGAYVVIADASRGPVPAPALLVNTTSAHAEPLTNSVAPLARFSSDGQLLRYLSIDANDQWSLVEHTLATGAEKTLYTLSDADRYQTFTADSDGSRWMYSKVVNRVPINTLINADGTTSTLEGGTREQPLQWRLFNNSLIEASLLCSSNCTLTLQTGDAVVNFPTPFEGLGVLPLAQPTPDSLVVVKDGEDLWLLRNKVDPLYLGKYDPVSVFTSVLSLTSPDQRYILAEDSVDPSQYMVWDLKSASVIARGSSDFGVQINYFDSGFIVISYANPDTALVYRYADQTQTIQDDSEGGRFFELLPDGTLLYSLGVDGLNLKRGIYRYDPATQTYTPLIAGARMIYTQPLR